MGVFSLSGTYGCVRASQTPLETSIKDILQPSSSQSGTFDICNSTDRLGQFFSFFWLNRLLSLHFQKLQSSNICSKISFCSYKYLVGLFPMLIHFRNPSFHNIHKRRMIDHRKTQKKHICFGIRQSTNTSVA